MWSALCARMIILNAVAGYFSELENGPVAKQIEQEYIEMQRKNDLPEDKAQTERNQKRKWRAVTSVSSSSSSALFSSPSSAATPIAPVRSSEPPAKRQKKGAK